MTENVSSSFNFVGKIKSTDIVSLSFDGSLFMRVLIVLHGSSKK